METEKIQPTFVGENDDLVFIVPKELFTMKLSLHWQQLKLSRKPNMEKIVRKWAIKSRNDYLKCKKNTKLLET